MEFPGAECMQREGLFEDKHYLTVSTALTIAMSLQGKVLLIIGVNSSLV
jgi:hypothetical protein